MAVINEFVFNHAGTDTNEYIEVFAAPEVALPVGGYTVLVIEGDGTDAGIIDRVHPVGPFDAAGYWTTGFLTNELENGTQTVLLVSGFTGTGGTDLDTNNDGVLDATPWTAIIDSVAVSDGGASDRTYSPVVLTAANIGAGFTPGGASRIPNGTDTDSVADWRLNDFDGEGLPGFTGSLSGAEVANTPNASNSPAAVGPGIIVTIQGLSVAEGGFGGGFSLRLATQPTADVVITVTPDAELSISSATTLTFTPANWNLEQGVAVSAVDDTDVEGTHSGTVVINPAVSTDLAYNGLDAPDQVFTITDNDTAGPVLTPIYAIQGAGHTSPLVGQQVVTSGIVTARSNNGFWMQEPQGDGDTRTSDGIFVFTGGPPGRAVGDAVQVSGTVTEFVRTTSSPGHLSITQITAPTVTVQSSGNPLPEAVVIGIDRLPPTEITDLDAFTEFNPVRDGVDFWESLEGMRVTLPDAIAVGPSFNSTSTAAVNANKAEVFAVANRGAGATGQNDAGGLTLSETDGNPERVAIQANQQVLAGVDFIAKVGDLLGNANGVLDYDSRGNFEIVLTAPITVTDGGLAKEAGQIARGDATNLSVGTYNVENLAGNGPQAKFDALGLEIATVLNLPDIIALQEIQDNNGTTNDGTVAADVTYSRLIASINAAATAAGITDLPNYQVLNIDPLNNTSGGAPGGNIRVGFLYDADRVELVAGSLRQVDPANGPAWAESRIPLAADFVFNGEIITVVNNHWASKGGSSPQFGTIQPLLNGGEDQRILQAQSVNAFVDDILALDPAANIVVMGDLNEFAWEEPLQIVTGQDAGASMLFDLFELSEPDPVERYEYVFDGNHQILDHLLVSQGLVDAGFAFQSIQINSQFPAASRSSDHDPAVARFLLPPQEAVLGFDLWRDAIGTANGVADWRDVAVNLSYTNESVPGEQRSADFDDSTGAKIARFLNTDGDVAVRQVDFASGSAIGPGAMSLDWQGRDAVLTLNTAWNSIKNVYLNEFSGDQLTVQNFVAAVFNFGAGSQDNDLLIQGSARVNGRTGDGDDTIVVEVDSDGGPISENRIVLTTGGGHDTVEVKASAFDWSGSFSPNHYDPLWTRTIANLGEGDDTFLGGDGTDIVTGGAGNDLLDGRGGYDIAVFTGNRADYTIAVLDAATGQTAISGTDGADEVVRFEQLRFDDGVLKFSGGIWV
jgi:hypothetical protein